MNTLKKLSVSLAMALCFTLPALAQPSPLVGDLFSPEAASVHSGQVAVSGWIANPEYPSRTMDIRISENGTVVHQGPANLQVRGLDAYLGEGNDLHGFHVVLENMSPGPHSLVVWAVDPVSHHLFWLANPVTFEVTPLSGQFTSPPYGTPVSTRFHLRGVLRDSSDPTRQVQGLLRYHNNLDNEVVEVALIGNQPDDLGGQQGFDLLLDLPDQRHWYMRLLVLDGEQEYFADFINLDTFCLPAWTGDDRDICVGQSTPLGFQVPTMSGESSLFSWTPGDSLDDSNVSNPIATPTETTTYTMTVVDQAGYCSDSQQVTVRVHGTEIFATASVPGCAPSGDMTEVHLDGQINAQTDGPVEYYWDLNGDGQVDYGPISDPAVTALAPAGTYQSVLYAVSGPGCVASDLVQFQVDPCYTGGDCGPRTVGYWRQQFDGVPAQKENACDYLADLESGSSVYFEQLDGTDPCAEIQTILEDWGGQPMRQKATRQLLGLWLNTLSAKVDWSTPISLPYAEVVTVGDAITWIESVLTDALAGAGELELAKDLADALNNSCGYLGGCTEACGLELELTKNSNGNVVMTWSRGEGPSYVVEEISATGVDFSQHNEAPTCQEPAQEMVQTPGLTTYRVTPKSR